MQVLSFNSSLTASFYIARVGQVGKPLKTHYTANNSFIVISDDSELDFQRVKAAYEAGAFKYYARGSCQAFIRLQDVRAVIARSEALNARHLKQMALLDAHIEFEQQKLDKQRLLLKELQRACFATC
ncbi:TPA: DUF6943 family protein [Photobacterium damselae]